MAHNTPAQDAEIDIRNLKPFQYKSLSAVLVKHKMDTDALKVGSLEQDEREKFRALEVAGKLRYVVYSYATPIAWVTTDGAKFVTLTAGSRTTSGHKAVVRRAFAPVDKSSFPDL